MQQSHYKGQNYSGQDGSYQHNISMSSGYFTQNNKAVGWALNQSLTLVQNTYPPNIHDALVIFAILALVEAAS